MVDGGAEGWAETSPHIYQAAKVNVENLIQDMKPNAYWTDFTFVGKITLMETLLGLQY